MILLFWLGFCKSRICITKLALSAIYSMVEPLANACSRLVISRTNDFPTELDGRRNELHFQFHHRPHLSYCKRPFRPVLPIESQVVGMLVSATNPCMHFSGVMPVVVNSMSGSRLPRRGPPLPITNLPLSLSVRIGCWSMTWPWLGSFMKVGPLVSLAGSRLCWTQHG